MKKIILLFNTIKYLKLHQIYFRILRKIVKPKVTEKLQDIEPCRANAWLHICLYDNKINSNLEAFFLNHTSRLDFPNDWNSDSVSKLWTYNLHYFEDLLSQNSLNKVQLHHKLIDLWVDQNPVGIGNGWEPYPTSLRIVNILKAWLGGLELNKKLFNSVYSQASYLSNDLEKHLLGNHYFVNLKALLFAGVIFGNLRWYKIAEKELLAEISEQILQDGTNFELSPMYHSLMLVDMLDMCNLSRAYPTRVSIQLASTLEDHIPRMITFMEAMAHPDGGVSFFNDSADGIAPEKEKIESYADKLGFHISHLELNDTQIIDNVNSGYLCATINGNKLIFDAASVGPDYIPAHAHADTLAFELSLAKQRVFVNSGTSEYGIGESRQNQRKTLSHNTLVIDDKDSSQVWGGFRVANRANVIGRSCEILSDNTISLFGEHDGYKSTFGGCTHSRRLILGNNSLVVTDSIMGQFNNARSYFYFHPELNVSLEQSILRVRSTDFSIQSDLTGLTCSLVDSSWHPQFGVLSQNKLLRIDFNQKKLEVCFVWTSLK